MNTLEFGDHISALHSEEFLFLFAEALDFLLQQVCEVDVLLDILQFGSLNGLYLESLLGIIHFLLDGSKCIGNVRLFRRLYLDSELEIQLVLEHLLDLLVQFQSIHILVYGSLEGKGIFGNFSTKCIPSSIGLDHSIDHFVKFVVEFLEVLSIVRVILEYIKVGHSVILSSVCREFANQLNPTGHPLVIRLAFLLSDGKLLTIVLHLFGPRGISLENWLLFCEEFVGNSVELEFCSVAQLGE